MRRDADDVLAPVLTLASYFIGPSPMDLSFTRGHAAARRHLAERGALLARIERAAALLLVPYAAWVGFAVALNAALRRLN